ncbi:hypothetical protein L202_08085 [Cryptococcus amylolentus CBS 6039]|uniref:Uncharacterized protein n=1 Tax=Cryptococcus amylolentus CBS 6039 TaxID=1295533 RepID=A0A1E3HBT1_9TREE|nr:hypothetical protein L202_08085 [Cryptococcus amylolentus CBS 6039]ODN73585.1 hypothetical protein L202_08085 [Cryptococcus amylolentus CBS 6039]
MIDEEKLAEEATNFLQQLKFDWASAKDQNTRIQELLEEQSKRFKEVYNKVLQQEAASHVSSKVLQQEAVIHRGDTEGLITRVSQLEATLANLSNSQKQEVSRDQELTDELVSRVAQLGITLANLTLQKTQSEIHVDVHMSPQQSSSTTAGNVPPRHSPHDAGSSDGRPPSSMSLIQNLYRTASLLMFMPDHHLMKDDIVRTFKEARSMTIWRRIPQA